MNYYPYYIGMPLGTMAPIARTGGLKALFGGIKWSSILSGTQKTLSVVNQAIPIIKQAGPVINNAKTMFRVMNEMRKIDVQDNQKNTVSVDNNNVAKESQPKVNTNQVGPTFFQ